MNVYKTVQVHHPIVVVPTRYINVFVNPMINNIEQSTILFTRLDVQFSNIIFLFWHRIFLHV
jgi:hypothetical protein